MEKADRQNNCIKFLKIFNRKERHHLIRQFCGSDPSRPGEETKDKTGGAAGAIAPFKLNGKTKEKIEQAIGAALPQNDKGYFAAMDYHLDWIYASLCLANNKKTKNCKNLEELLEIVEKAKEEEKLPKRENIPSYKRDEKASFMALDFTIEDVDFLIVFTDADGITHFIMIEAKYAGNFTNKQIQSKIGRLRAIFFDKDEDRWKEIKVKPHFILCSPREPTTRLLNGDIPCFMRNEERGFKWIELEMEQDHARISRCNEIGEPSREGKHWCIFNAPKVVS